MIPIKLSRQDIEQVFLSDRIVYQVISRLDDRDFYHELERSSAVLMVREVFQKHFTSKIDLIISPTKQKAILMVNDPNEALLFKLSQSSVDQA